MSWGGPGFVIAIIALSMGAWVITTWIRAKHGYPLEDEWGGKTVHPRHNNADSQKLIADNRALSERLENAEDRLAVLERIVTDQGYLTSREIEALRDKTETK
ncbi:hypothetical protein E5222_03040 [Alteraurantiacibacter aquimixticola]|uniref:Uncharacterized protein n=2 Tax=Alteraurantiacibacter aquimixticola TaxID=2489173 RepID=A0A4T3F5H6_9SPHN|nr:hypothetical protein [Alteraurantiacibacter aquimixticola]TIX52121.1 hypothetical protein E5222_03040 [Alteraurantiacibacter aquimixticola]